MFLQGIGIKHIEGCSIGGKHYVVFTLHRARRASDIIRAVEEQNQISRVGSTTTDLEEELLMASDGVLADGASTIVLMPVNEGGGVVSQGQMVDPSPVSLVAVFDKGHAYHSHAIYQMINAARVSQMHVQPPPVAGEFNVSVTVGSEAKPLPTGYWSWTASGVVDVSVARKRAVSELVSDLVEVDPKPKSVRRARLVVSAASVLSSAPDAAAGFSKEAVSDIESEIFGSSGATMSALVAPVEDGAIGSQEVNVSIDGGVDTTVSLLELEVFVCL
jgi:hypothetical protein